VNALIERLRSVDRRALAIGGAVAAAIALVMLVLPELPMRPRTQSGQWETPLPATVLGVIQGMTYGLLSVGLVLVYRTNRIINFAHGAAGAFAAAFLGIAVVNWHLPYWVAMVPALVIGAGIGALTEAAVIRRLRKAPLVMSVVATLGAGQFLIAFAYAINSAAGAGARYPQPASLPVFQLGALRITQAYSGMLFITPVVVIALAIFLKRSAFGLAMRSAAANPEAARMSGIFASRMSSLAWAISACLAALTAILTQPTQGFTSGQSFGPSLLLRAMTGAVLARMVSLPLALLGGIGLGVLEQLLLWNYPQSGLVEVALFVIILVTLLIQRPRTGRAEERGSWAAVQAMRPLPPALREIWAVRNLGLIAAAPVIAVALLLPLFVTNTTAVQATGMFAFAIVALSVGVVTGLGGQLSLGQWALASIGAVVSYEISRRTGSFFLSFLYAGLGAAAVSLVIGLPALRIKGLLLTVTTLSFALVTPGWLLQQPWALETSKDPGRPILFGNAFTTGKEYYWVALLTLVVAYTLAWNVRRSGIGRSLVSVRDNEDNARSFTVPASLVKVQGFLIAGFLAGIGGAMYGHSLSSIGGSSFQVDSNIAIVQMAVIGGLGILAGPVLGALFIGIVPFLPLDSAGLAATSFGLLLVVMYLPAGIAGFAQPLRDRIAKALARRAGIDVEAAYGTPAAGGSSVTVASSDRADVIDVERFRRRREGTVLLDARDLRKSFGGVHAVRGVSLHATAGETVGLIGPNGAGKTTTFELLAGFTSLDSGTVRFDGRDVTLLGPESRGRLGLIRSFQDAALFPTMSVLEAVTTALERTDPTRFITGLVGFVRGERRKQQRAMELISFMGLESYQALQIQELSTGTRRIVELACMVALEPTLLLLDEPSSGVAQRETEALGRLLRNIKSTLGTTLVVIEHDIPLIMGLADRIIAMADGQVIAEGPPDVVRNDPAVVAAYLGADRTAIERSSKRQRPKKRAAAVR
jgi:ABC-type branched-subunit amino acid transport system ATPase component/ABC-type branched-subunit amino acid transport system permease subunit